MSAIAANDPNKWWIIIAHVATRGRFGTGVETEETERRVERECKQFAEVVKVSFSILREAIHEIV